MNISWIRPTLTVEIIFSVVDETLNGKLSMTTDWLYKHRNMFNYNFVSRGITPLAPIPIEYLIYNFSYTFEKNESDDMTINILVDDSTMLSFDSSGNLITGGDEPPIN